MQTQREVKDLTFRAQKAEYAAQVATAKMETTATRDDATSGAAKSTSSTRSTVYKNQKQEKTCSNNWLKRNKRRNPLLYCPKNTKRGFQPYLQKMGTDGRRCWLLKGRRAVNWRVSYQQRRTGLEELKGEPNYWRQRNTRIQGEIQYWNELYSQETGTTPPPPVSSASVLISPPVEGSMVSSPLAESNVTAAIPNCSLGKFYASRTNGFSSIDVISLMEFWIWTK